MHKHMMQQQLIKENINSEMNLLNTTTHNSLRLVPHNHLEQFNFHTCLYNITLRAFYISYLVNLLFGILSHNVEIFVNKKPLHASLALDLYSLIK